MQFNVLNLENKTAEQLNELINAAGTTVPNFYRWVHKTRATARNTFKKIQKIESSILYADYSPAIKLALRDKRQLAVAKFDACELIMTELNYTPPQRVFLTKDSIEQMFVDACNVEGPPEETPL
jgi:hypothetical protein